ncbi:MFS transporter, partial [Pseudonocardia pini]|uniref:MFS transporter n=1 Tax=Pseudonocardia pini TaxID=2758030 RepID=UPI0015F10384
VGERAPAGRTGLALAIQNTAVAGGMALTPSLFGALLGRTSWAWSFAVVATVTTAAALLLVRPAAREARLDPETPPAPDAVPMADREETTREDPTEPDPTRSAPTTAAQHLPLRTRVEGVTPGADR